VTPTAAAAAAVDPQPAAAVACTGAYTDMRMAGDVAVASPPPVPHAVLVAISTSSTFLALLHAIQHTHPTRARSHTIVGDPTTHTGGLLQGISKELRFFPLQSTLITLASLRTMQPCAGNLYRTWGATMTMNASATTADDPPGRPNGASSSIPSSARQLRHSDDILMGRLVVVRGDPDSRMSAPDLLCLEDATSRIPVVMIRPDVSLLGR
jgi:hypothetical protein